MGYGSRSAREGNETADPNDVAEAAESGSVLDDVPADLLREVAAIRKLLADDPEGALVPVDYSVRLRLLSLVDENRDMTA